jgi:hypothetical protein
MLYAIYLPDGSIQQANKAYDPEGLDYDNQLNDIGHKFVKVNSPGLLPPDFWYVDVNAKELVVRPVMQVNVNKTIIHCGDQDSCIITGIPKQAKARVTLRDGTEIYPSFVLDAAELEISIPTPCTWQVHLDLWPYQTCTINVEAVV